jgi:hypothetical protein
MKKTEDVVRREYEAAGYRVLRNGWPDFLMLKDGEPAFCVEVKTNNGGGGGEQLHEGQAEMHAALHSIGLPTLIRFVPGPNQTVTETETEKENRLLSNARAGKNKRHNPKKTT